MSDVPSGGLFYLETDSPTATRIPLESPISPSTTPSVESPFIPLSSPTTTKSFHSHVQLSTYTDDGAGSPNPSSTGSSAEDSPRNVDSPDFDRATVSDSSSKGSLRTNSSAPTPRLPILAPAPTAVISQPSLFGPPPIPGGIQQSGGTGLGISSHRNRGFTAPTAPSPLARASIVPPTSDSEEKSSTESMDDGEHSEMEREGTASGSGSGAATVTNRRNPKKAKRVSPRRTSLRRDGEGSGSSLGDGTAEAGPGPSTMRQRESPPYKSGSRGGSPNSSPKMGTRKEKFSLGSPSVSTSGLSSSYTYPHAMPSGTTATTPGMILRGKTRQGSGSSAGSTFAAATSPQKSSPTDSDIALAGPGWTNMATSPRQRTRSGSFGSAFGSYEGRQRSESGSSHISRMSLLGLTGPTGNTASTDKAGNYALGLGGLEGGADLSRGGSLRESPARSRSKARQTSGGSVTLGDSPTRSRRLSEYLGPSGDTGGRRMSIAGSNMGPPRMGPSISSMIPVSTVSPLNPLPSPWAGAATDAAGNRAPGMTDSPLTSGAIRLTRVPESVRQSISVASLMDSPASGPTSLSGSLRLATSPIPEVSLRNASGMPSIPATPAATRMPTPEDALSPTELGSPPILRSLPNSPRAQQRGLGRTRPMPATSAFGPVLESVTPPAIESPPLQPPSSELGPGALRSWNPLMSGTLRMPSPLLRARSSTSSATSPTDQIGLGLAMSSNSFGSRMSVGAMAKPRLLSGHSRQISAHSIDQDALNKDLLGDASRHASMILQSRKAKLQRWRPNSAGQDPTLEDLSLTKPPMARASSSSELLALRLPGDRLGAWKMQSGERRDGEAVIDRAPIPTESSPRHPLHRSSYGPEEIQLNEDFPQKSSQAMMREASQSGSVNGVEWVDWFDEYKRYKEAKLDAERVAERASFVEPVVPSAAVLAPRPLIPMEQSSDGQLDLDTQMRESPRNSLQLQPTKSRSSLVEPLQRYRSSSIRSNASTALTAIPNVQASPPPASKRNSLGDRTRQASHVLTKSQQMTAKRKKNLSTKMEGWWNAVKSNFNGISPAQDRRTPASMALEQQAGVASRATGQTMMRSLRDTAVSPTVRRGSEQDSQSLVGDPASDSRPRWLRSVTSHADIGTSSNTSPAPPLAGDVMPVPPAPAQRSSSEPNAIPFAPGDSPVNLLGTTSRLQNQRSTYKPMPSGLETRRRQPQLSLKLEQTPLSFPLHFHHRTTSSASGISRDAGSLWGSGGGLSSRHSSGMPSPFTSMAPGMTPALTQWDHQRGSPMWASGDRHVSDGKDASATSQTGDASSDSALKLVRRRVAAAKEACDTELREVIKAITAFVESHMHQTPFVLDSALEADDDTDQERPMERLLDAFDPDSDTDSGQLGIPIARPRQHSSLSRSGSTSLASSPLKRRDFMPSSFKAVPAVSSPDRRRSSGQRPIARPSDMGQRLSRNLNMAVSRSGASSRSTSRSRSPLPGSSVMNYLNTFETDSPVDMELIQGLQEIITIATDVLDLGLNALIARPAVCEEAIAKVREIGLMWDQNPSSPGRPWYVRLLMAVAGLTRVMDWWGAEKDFWNFDADNDEDNEPLTFVMKPLKEGDLMASGNDALGNSTAAERRHQDLPLRSAISLGGTSSVPVIEVPSPAGSPQNLTVRPDITTTSNQIEATPDLLIQAEHAKTVNIVLELSLGEELIEWANPAWQEVIGGDPEEVIGTPITAWLAPADVEIVANASRQLEKDDSLTAQARFRLARISSSADEEDADREPGPSFIEFEGIGMLMRDRETSAPSHTMWVIKPVTSTNSAPTVADDPLEDASAGVRPALLGQIAHILCRICERDIPLWYFEKHNETCNEVHRLEADIALVNEKLEELKDAFVEIRAAIDSPVSGGAARYHGELVCQAASRTAENGSATLLHAVKRLQLGQLDDAVAILSSTLEISTPSVREEDLSDGRQYQSLLSPRSEDKLTMVARWLKPDTEDPGLSLILSDLDDLLRQKHMAVNRMRNTILYSERVRQEWEEKMQRMMAIAEESSGESSSQDKSEEESEAGAREEPGGVEDNELPIAPVPKKLPSRRLSTVPGLERNRLTTRHASLGDGPIARLQTPDSGLSSTSDLLSSRRGSSADGAASPRMQSTVPASKTAAPSIKDFDIIKPISRGAFGSVYLARKRATGDYFAIKALKKADMIAKNQITNVKAERTILMSQASSPYVAKLFFSFQNKDYLYLVMEYLNGGDCAALIKTLGGLPEEWTRNYIAEVILGLEYLHERRIVHRDLKPDNLLIDAHGHLKLTDFGLSRIGLLGRQVGGPRPAYLKQASLHRVQGSYSKSPNSGSLYSSSPLTPPDGNAARQGYFGSRASDAADDSSGSESLAGGFRKAGSATGEGTHSRTGSNAPKVREVPKFVGTPDYLCPESILGIGADDDTVDWWALGVVMYEFLYGFPPFHAETPEKVFDNIISRRINWFEEDIEVSIEARDLMERLMCSDPGQRLGRNGAIEVKGHAFFAEIDWNTIATVDANFVPQVSDPENTEYFDARGAVPQVFDETGPEAGPTAQETDTEPPNEDPTSTVVLKDPSRRKLSASPAPFEGKAADEFGQFTYKNLPVLKQHNDEVIRKLRSDQVIPSAQSMTMSALRDRRLSQVGMKRKSKIRPMLLENMPPSPAPSTASSGSQPSQAGGQPRTPSTAMPEAQDSLSRSQSQPLASLPSSLATGTARDVRMLSGSSSLGAVHNRAVDVLVAEDNPISQKILATLLERMGCRCVCVNDGAEALSATMGDIRFDLMIFDLVMPNVSGEEAARMIRSTSNHNADTPIIAATSYEHRQTDIGSGAIFSAILIKPVTKKDLAECFQKLGFVLGSVGKAGAPPLTAVGRHQPKHGDLPPGEGAMVEN